MATGGSITYTYQHGTDELSVQHPQLPQQPGVPVAYSNQHGADKPPVQQMAVDQQPQQGQSIAILPGIQCLATMDQVSIKQHFKELVDIITGWQGVNKYAVLSKEGRDLFYAKEVSNACQRQCCGISRAFQVSIIDQTGQEVIKVDRPYKCGYPTCNTCKSCEDAITVEAPPGTPIGKVSQDMGDGTASYRIEDTQGNAILLIRGFKICACRCQCNKEDIDFFLQTVNGQEIGRISKQWTNLGQELFTDTTNFSILFPANLDLNLKAVIIGACFYIDFVFFTRHKSFVDYI